MFMTKNTLTTVLIVPALSLSILAVQPAAMEAGAYAQTNDNGASLKAPSRSERKITFDSGGDGGSTAHDGLRPCRPQAVATHLVPCRPWTPPKVQVSSEAECECQVRRVNGRLVKDCYVMVRQLVHYCRNNQLFRAN